MPLDPNSVKWDDEKPKAKSAPIGIKWDDKPDEGTLKNIALGALKGATDIGNTLITPVRRPLNAALTSVGLEPTSAEANKQFFADNANPDSLAFKGGDLAASVAGTAGIGGAFAKGARALGAAPKIVAALESGGFNLGGAAPATARQLAENIATRIGAGAAVGGASAGLINPSDAGTGALIGGALPGVAKVAGTAGNLVGDGLTTAAQKLMQSALKPTATQRASGDAAIAIKEMLDRGINVSKGGVEKLQSLIDDLNSQIKSAISGSSASVDQAPVMATLSDVRNTFGNQVSPTGDLAAIQAIADDFAQHPAWVNGSMPVQTAQDLKQGTYRVLKGKFGEAGSAATEAQKGLARGLKEQIAAAVPGVAGMNAEESALLRALGVVDRSAELAANKNPIGLSALAQNPVAAGAFALDRSAMAKSLAARAANTVGSGAAATNWIMDALLANPEVRAAILATSASPAIRQ